MSSGLSPPKPLRVCSDKKEELYRCSCSAVQCNCQDQVASSVAPVEVRAQFWEKFKTHKECHIPNKVLNPDPCVQKNFKQTLMPFGASPTRIVYPDPPKDLKQTKLAFRTSEDPWPEAQERQKQSKKLDGSSSESGSSTSDAPEHAPAAPSPPRTPEPKQPKTYVAKVAAPAPQESSSSSSDSDSSTSSSSSDSSSDDEEEDLSYC